MTLQGDAKFKGKLTRGFKNDIGNLVSFHASSRKPENLHFDGLALSKAYKVLDEKVQKSYASWHWRMMEIKYNFWEICIFCVMQWTWSRQWKVKPLPNVLNEINFIINLDSFP